MHAPRPFPPRSLARSASAITLASHVVASDALVSCDLAGEAVILSLQTELYYALDTVGSRVWELVQEPRAVAAVCDALAAEYDVEPARCEADVLRLLTDLAGHGLVEEAAAA